MRRMMRMLVPAALGLIGAGCTLAAGAPLSPAAAQASADAPLAAMEGRADAICSRYFAAYQDRSEEGGGMTLPPMVLPAPALPPPPPPPPSLPVAETADASSITVTAMARATPRTANRERYAGEAVAGIMAVADAPVSTFSVDVDTGSYANVRRMLTDGELPPAAAVRTEEMLNYFRYDYPAPASRDAPFAVATDVTRTPWNEATRIVRIGLTGFDLPRENRVPANLVFLVDVSGSMNSLDKLPLVQCSLALAAEQLDPRDRIAIVTYAGSSGVLLEPTSDKQAVLRALDGLQAGGSTAGASAIELAYDLARRNYREAQVNRIILATDGDFNVGLVDNDALVDMVEREREAGISLTTLGFGTGNYNEAMMEQIADHGNGNYFYIDGPEEAAKVLGSELASTLFTIASDVKVQVEFNPAYVAEYRLIGYENRALAEEDFTNDAVDAGEIGAGHQVTALYEVVPAGADGWLPDRRYEANRRPQASGDRNGEAAMVSLRYKPAQGRHSRLVEVPLPVGMLVDARPPAGETAFALAVAGYGQLLRGDTRLGDWTYRDSAALAQGSASSALRRQFIGLARRAAELERSGGG